MAQDYKVTGVKTVGEPDQYGNVAYSIFLQGVQGGVFIKAKNPPEIGKTEYGEVKTETGNSGKQYTRFYRKQREENKFKADPEKQAQIKAQFAIKAAISYSSLVDQTRSGPVTVADIENTAKSFFTMVDRVKNSESNPKDEPVKPEQTYSDNDDIDTDSPINLDDIPF